MSADNVILARIEDQDEATRAGFEAIDSALAAALGFDVEFGAGRYTLLSQWETVRALRQERTRIATGFMTSLLANPNTKGTVAAMADWAVLAADVLLTKLATQRAVRVPAGTATPPA